MKIREDYIKLPLFRKYRRVDGLTIRTNKTIQQSG